MNRYIFLIVIGTLITLTGHAQHSPVFSQFFTNPYLINPAYVGIENRPVLFTTHRQQWMGVDGAPVSSNFNFHTPVVLGLSAGVNFYNDSRSLLSTNVGSLTLGYAIGITDKEYIRFGISAGAGFRNFDINAVDNPSDPALGDIVENSTFLAGNAGVTFHSGYFSLGFALPQIFESDIMPTGSALTENISISPLDRFIVNASYRIYFGLDELAFEPHFVYYSYKGIPAQWEALGIFHIKYNLWAGGSYRKDFGISGLLGIKVGNVFSIGYSYTIPSKTVSLGIATHEIQLALLLKKNQRKENQALSFVDNERVYWGVTEEVSASSFFGETGYDVPPDEPVFDFERDQTIVQTETDTTIRSGPRFQREGIVPTGIIHSLSSSDEEFIRQTGERYEITQAGDHVMELIQGIYIMVNTAQDLVSAQEFRDLMRNSGQRVLYGFSSQKNTWYNYAFREDSSEGLMDELNSAKQNPLFEEVWFFIVE